jgi:hypothetical protein
MNKHIQILELVTTYLGQVNIAIPIIFGAVAGISGIIKGITGSGPSLAELANLIESQLGQNNAAIKAEIARLKAVLGLT